MGALKSFLIDRISCAGGRVYLTQYCHCCSGLDRAMVLVKSQEQTAGPGLKADQGQTAAQTQMADLGFQAKPALDQGSRPEFQPTGYSGLLRPEPPAGSILVANHPATPPERVAHSKTKLNPRIHPHKLAAE